MRVSDPERTLIVNPFDPAMRERLRNAILTPIDQAHDDGSNKSGDEPEPFYHDVFLSIDIKALAGCPGAYIAQSDRLSQFGTGDTPYDALRDLFATMADHMAFLERHELVLSRGLACELGNLRTLAGNGKV